MNAFILFLPSQLHQGVSDVPVSCVVVDDLRSLLGALVPAGAEQRLQLQEVDVFEDVGGGLLPGPRFWSLPCRGADYRRRSAHDEVTRKPLILGSGDEAFPGCICEARVTSPVSHQEMEKKQKMVVEQMNVR